MSAAVLVVRTRALGDVVLTTPALRALRRGYPDATIDVVTDARYAPILEGLPGVERVLPMQRTAPGTRALIAALRRRRYAAAVDLQCTPRTALLVGLSGARRRVGYDVRGRRVAYDVRVSRAPSPANERREYAAAGHVRVACAAGGIEDGLLPRVHVPERARGEAERLLETAGVVRPETTVGLVAAGTWATKTWPLSHAIDLARRLIADGMPLLLLAGPGEEHVTHTMGRLVRGLAVLPPCDVPVLAAVIERLGGVAGTDSGARHLAVALAKPTFGWFGPTHPHNWTPADDRHAVWWADVPCRGCSQNTCPHWTCMPRLQPAAAAELIRAHFERHVPDAADLGSAAGA